MLDLTSFEKAITQLERALIAYDSPVARSHPELQDHLRAGAIQAFEFTFELSFRTLKRFLADIDRDPAKIAEMSYNSIIRLGYDKGLLSSELDAWKEFREQRATTSHVYLEAKAEQVFAKIPAFLAEAQFLRDQLKRRLAEER